MKKSKFGAIIFFAVLMYLFCTVSVWALGKVPRYRLYNPNNHHHHYTTDANEYNALATLGWIQEGAGCYLYNEMVTIDSVNAVPYYRVYNPNSFEHHWTTDANEYNVLEALGWVQEGADGYVFATQVSGSEPLYRLYNPNDGLHHWTMDTNERDVLIGLGFIDEGIACYVFPYSIAWLQEGNFWKVAWHEVEINVGWTGGYGDYDLGSYTLKIGPPQQIAGLQMFELIVTGDTSKYTPLWEYIGADTNGNVYGIKSNNEAPVLIFSEVDDTWSGSGFYADFEGETGILVNRNGYMAPSQYTKQSGYSGILTSIGWSKDKVVYSGSGCEYFAGYGTICGETGTGAGPDVDNEMHFEYWSPTAGPVGMHKAYNYENCIGFYCNEKHVEQRIEVWHFGDKAGAVDFIYENEPDTYAEPTLIHLGDISGQVFSVYGDIYNLDMPSGVIDGYSAVVSDELMAKIKDWYPFTAQEGQDIAEQVHDWYKFEISSADAGRNLAFYLVWSQAETNLNFYLFTAPDNQDFGFLYLGQENWLDTMEEFSHSKGFDGTLAAGTYLLGVQRTTPSDFATEYGILVLLGNE